VIVPSDMLRSNESSSTPATMSLSGDWCGVEWACGKVHLADTRLEPASHANTKNP
jgi:hypothetical protein